MGMYMYILLWYILFRAHIHTCGNDENDGRLNSVCSLWKCHSKNVESNVII